MFLPLTNIMKLLAIACLSFLTLSGNAHAQAAPNDRYPNELPGYRFFATAKWNSLEPLVSTAADIRRVLGKPTSEVDLSQYFEPYPGDDRAKRPVLTYDIDDGWEALIYLGRSCFAGIPSRPALRLCTIDLIPKKRIAFDKVKFPTAFKKNNVAGADAAWDEFADGSGLSYHVYTTGTPYGHTKPGDLNRIVYGPSNESLARYASKSP
jgi:hypothetical protein